MDSNGKFWVGIWGVFTLFIVVVISLGTYSGVLDDRHDQIMASKGYDKVKTLSCIQYTTTTEYKLNVRGE